MQWQQVNFAFLDIAIVHLARIPICDRLRMLRCKSISLSLRSIEFHECSIQTYPNHACVSKDNIAALFEAATCAGNFRELHGGGMPCRGTLSTAGWKLNGPAQITQTKHHTSFSRLLDSVAYKIQWTASPRAGRGRVASLKALLFSSSSSEMGGSSSHFGVS